MSKRDEEIFESLLLGGILGAALSALISKSSRGGGPLIGALAGAAILASVRANEKARKTEIPLILEEDHVLYEVYPDGRRKFIKRIRRSKRSLPQKFTLR